MSTTVRTTRRPATPADVLFLQFANPTRLVVVPLGILVAVVVVMIVVTFAIVRAGGSASATGYSGAVLWSLIGFITSVGVQGVAVTFPFALALGSTRRTFVLGTLASTLALAGVLTLTSLVLLGLELATRGWFIGARVLSDMTLGGGDPLRLATVMFLTMLTALSVGGVFGATFVRFGARGPLLLGVGIAVLIAVVLVLLLPVITAGFQVWWLAVGAALIIAVSAAAQYLLLRRASVR